MNEKLDELAWAAVGGNFSAGAALGQVVGTAAEVISWSGKINQFVLTKTPGTLRSPAPLLGEHNEYICKEILGLSDDEIAEALVEQALY